MIKAIALFTPVYVTLFWSLVLLPQKKPGNKAKSTLGLFMTVACLLYISHTIFFHKFYHLYSYVETLYIAASLALYPLFYAYICQLANKIQKKGFVLLQYMPAIIIASASLLLTLLLHPEERIFYVKDALIEKNLKHLNIQTFVGLKGTVFLISRIIFIVQTLFFLVLGIRVANAHNQSISNYFSDTEGRKMSWVRVISIIVLILSVAGIAFALIGRSYFVKNEIFLLIPSLLFGTIFFMVGFKGNQQVSVPAEFVADEGLKTEFERVGAEKKDVLKKQLVELFEVTKIYRHTDLRITTVSSSLNTNRTYVSRLINDEFGINFNEYVNIYRIQEAKQLLSSKDNMAYTMEYIAEKSGFGSVASFSRVFKEFERITPGKYRMEHQDVLSS